MTWSFSVQCTKDTKVTDAGYTNGLPLIAPAEELM